MLSVPLSRKRRGGTGQGAAWRAHVPMPRPNHPHAAGLVEAAWVGAAQCLGAGSVHQRLRHGQANGAARGGDASSGLAGGEREQAGGVREGTGRERAEGERLREKDIGWKNTYILSLFSFFTFFFIFFFYHFFLFF